MMRSRKASAKKPNHDYRRKEAISFSYESFSLTDGQFENIRTAGGSMDFKKEQIEQAVQGFSGRREGFENAACKEDTLSKIKNVLPHLESLIAFATDNDSATQAARDDVQNNWSYRDTFCLEENYASSLIGLLRAAETSINQRSVEKDKGGPNSDTPFAMLLGDLAQIFLSALGSQTLEKKKLRDFVKAVFDLIPQESAPVCGREYASESSLESRAYSIANKIRNMTDS